MTYTHRVPEHLKREAEIQLDVVRFYKALGVRVYVTSEPRKKFCSPGVLDLFLILPMRRGTAWFDVKQPNDAKHPHRMELDEDQREFALDLEFAGVPWSCGGKTEAVLFADRLGLLVRG